MPRTAERKDLNLKALELFQTCARCGSLKATAQQAGLSVSTVSHHLKSLEDHVGAELFNHARRPLTLTPKGHAFLRNIDVALLAIRKAKAEAAAGAVTEVRHLRIGAIDDLDSDITPQLAVYLKGVMPACSFSFSTNSSHMLIEMLRNRELDLAVTTAPTEHLRDLREIPLIKDPFIIAAPAHLKMTPDDLLRAETGLPFLRFSENLVIGRQIEAQLRRLGHVPAFEFECDNNQTLMAMIGAGAGWAITTPMLYARAQRFHAKATIHPFPSRRFARNLSIVVTPDCTRSVLSLIDTKLRDLIRTNAIMPVCQAAPWLEGQFAFTT